MAEIKVIIKIDESKFEALKSELYNTFPKEMKEWGLEVIRNGTRLNEEKANDKLSKEEKYLQCCLYAVKEFERRTYGVSDREDMTRKAMLWTDVRKWLEEQLREASRSEIDEFDEDVFSVKDIYYRLLNAGATGEEINAYLHLICKYCKD